MVITVTSMMFMKHAPCMSFTSTIFKIQECSKNLIVETVRCESSIVTKLCLCHIFLHIFYKKDCFYIGLV